MPEQNYKNHSRIVYGYYAITGLPILLLIGISVKMLVDDSRQIPYPGFVLLIIGWILFTLLFRARGFALKAQDRAIRAEENLRYFILTGKRMDPRITISQVIALRFASDEELPELTQKTIEEGLSNAEIKKRIRKWKADFYRI